MRKRNDGEIRDDLIEGRITVNQARAQMGYDPLPSPTMSYMDYVQAETSILESNEIQINMLREQLGLGAVHDDWLFLIDLMLTPAIKTSDAPTRKDILELIECLEDHDFSDSALQRLNSIIDMDQVVIEEKHAPTTFDFPKHHTVYIGGARGFDKSILQDTLRDWLSPDTDEVKVDDHQHVRGLYTNSCEVCGVVLIKNGQRTKDHPDYQLLDVNSLNPSEWVNIGAGAKGAFIGVQSSVTVENLDPETVNLFSGGTLDGEVRTTSSTGAEKGMKPERFDLIPVEALATLARLYGRGAEKYAAHNWRKGYEWSKSYAALNRHLTAFWGGEDIDEETGMPHMACVAFHAFTLMTFMEEHRDFDDRFKKGAKDKKLVHCLLCGLYVGHSSNECVYLSKDIICISCHQRDGKHRHDCKE